MGSYNHQPNPYHGISLSSALPPLPLSYSLPPPPLLSDSDSDCVSSVVLRRRIPLTKKILSQAIVTPHADNILTLVCTRDSSQPLPSPKKDHWVADQQVTHCPVTGKKFGLFVRRHHCRISGGIYSEEVCNFRFVQVDISSPSSHTATPVMYRGLHTNHHHHTTTPAYLSLTSLLCPSPSVSLSLSRCLFVCVSQTVVT
jgi:hypothetical protein